MKYIVYVEDNEELRDEFIRNPRNQYDGEVHAMSQKTRVYTFNRPDPTQLKFILSTLAIKHPGRQIVCAKVESTAQAPYFAGEVAFTTLSEKGLLPE